jgi:hypothetical protein
MTVCVKTPKGIEEVAKRSEGVSLKARRLLIMVDGSRDFETLAGMFPGDDSMAMLEKLLADGYITPRVIEPPRTQEPAAPAAPAIALPQVDPGQRYEMARNFMLNTTSAFLGVFGSALSEKIERAVSLEDLQDLYVPWRDAIRLSSDGKKRADELETRLASLLS